MHSAREMSRPVVYLRNEDDTAAGFVRVSLDQDHSYIPFSDIAEEFQISSVLECDEQGSVLPRSLLISHPTAALKDGGFYIARRTNVQRYERDGSEYLVGNGGGLSNPHRDTMPFVDTIGDKRPRAEEEEDNQENIFNDNNNISQSQGSNKPRKGVAFHAKVAVTEFTIGGNSSSDSFRTSLTGYSTSAGRPPSLTPNSQASSSREPLRALSAHCHDDWFTSMEVIPFEPYTSDNGEIITEDTVMQWLRNAKDRETLVPLQMQEANRILEEVDTFLADQREKGLAE